MKKKGVYYSQLTERIAHVFFGIIEKLSPQFAGWIAYTIFYTPIRKVKSDFVKLKVKQKRHLIGNKQVNIYLAGEGKTILLVHGWEMSAARYESLMVRIIGAGYSVVTCDLPAHGKSEGRNSDIVEIGKVIEELNNFYGPFVGAIGHSYGAAALSRIANKLQNDLKIMILFACPTTYQSMVELFIELFGLGEKAQTSFIERIHKRYRTMRFDRELDFRDVLKRFKVPILIVHDTDDQVIPVEQSKALKAALNNVTLITTKGLGHHRLLRDVFVIDQVINLIKREIKNECFSKTL